MNHENEFLVIKCERWKKKEILRIRIPQHPVQQSAKNPPRKLKKVILSDFCTIFITLNFLVTSSEESESENENVTRRPGERGKSAIKEIQDDGEDDAYSPIEG